MFCSACGHTPFGRYPAALADLQPTARPQIAEKPPGPRDQKNFTEKGKGKGMPWPWPIHSWHEFKFKFKDLLDLV